jgi:hydroxymethylpyrimidine pyrophosphatase-like HAD family hydrolase
VIGKEPPLLELEKEILGSFGDQVETHCFDNMYCPGWYWLTVHDELATKDRAIETLRENYGLKDRELVVFGDQTNDVKMFEVAHRGIAVANAVESLKKKASQVIGSNDEDSVVRFLERDWKRLKGLS